MNSESYDLGLLAGDIIISKFLPTLETDMLRTNNIIKITNEKELSECRRLEKILDNSYKFNGGDGNSKEHHKNWIGYVYELAEKYLPEKLECRIPKVNPTNMEDFKEGLYWSLWDSDLSWYFPEDDFFIPNNEYAWCSVIILTRRIK